MAFAPNDCSSPKPDVEGSSPSAPVVSRKLKRLILPVESTFLGIGETGNIGQSINMYLHLFLIGFHLLWLHLTAG